MLAVERQIESNPHFQIKADFLVQLHNKRVLERLQHEVCSTNKYLFFDFRMLKGQAKTFMN